MSLEVEYVYSVTYAENIWHTHFFQFFSKEVRVALGLLIGKGDKRPMWVWKLAQ